MDRCSSGSSTPAGILPPPWQGVFGLPNSEHPAQGFCGFTTPYTTAEGRDAPDFSAGSSGFFSSLGCLRDGFPSIAPLDITLVENLLTNLSSVLGRIGRWEPPHTRSADRGSQVTSFPFLLCYSPVILCNTSHWDATSELSSSRSFGANFLVHLSPVFATLSPLTDLLAPHSELMPLIPYSGCGFFSWAGPSSTPPSTVLAGVPNFLTRNLFPALETPLLSLRWSSPLLPGLAPALAANLSLSSAYSDGFSFLGGGPALPEHVPFSSIVGLPSGRGKARCLVFSLCFRGKDSGRGNPTRGSCRPPNMGPPCAGPCSTGEVLLYTPVHHVSHSSSSLQDYVDVGSLPLNCPLSALHQGLRLFRTLISPFCICSKGNGGVQSTGGCRWSPDRGSPIPFFCQDSWYTSLRYLSLLRRRFQARPRHEYGLLGHVVGFRHPVCTVTPGISPWSHALPPRNCLGPWVRGFGSAFALPPPISPLFARESSAVFFPPLAPKELSPPPSVCCFLQSCGSTSPLSPDSLTLGRDRPVWAENGEAKNPGPVTGSGFPWDLPPHGLLAGSC